MHKALVSLGIRWLKRRCSIVFFEFATTGNESPDIIGWGSGFSTLVECKASKADFLRDAKKLTRKHPYLGMGQHRYYLCPWGLIETQELPKGWGLLWVRNNRVSIKWVSDYHEINQTGEIRFLVSMLRRAQIRLGKRHLAEWLHIGNMNEKPQEGRDKVGQMMGHSTPQMTMRYEKVVAEGLREIVEGKERKNEIELYRTR